MDNMEKGVPAPAKAVQRDGSAAKCNWCAQAGIPSDCAHCPNGGASVTVPQDMYMSHGFPAGGTASWMRSATALPADSITALLMQSGIRLSYHYMDSNAEKESFSALTEDEQAKLKEILIKLLVSWDKWSRKNL